MSDWKADMASLKGRSEEEAANATIDVGSQTETPPQDQSQSQGAPQAGEQGKGDTQNQANAQAKKALTPEEYEARYNQSRGAIREERGKRREAERRAQETAAQLQAYAQQTAQLQQTVQALMARQLAGQPAQAPANAPNAQPNAGYAPQGYQDQSPYIDPNEAQANPLQALARMVEHNNRQQYEAQQREAAERQRQIENARQQQEGLERARYVHTLTSSIDEAEADFAEDHPDYGDASKFLVDTAMEQLKVRFPALAANPKALHQQVTVEMLTMAEQARAAGMDPAQVYYNAAKALGFGRAAPAPTPGQGAPPAQTTPAAADPLAAIRAGQAAARSSGAGGDAALTDGMSLSDILNLDGASFASASRKFLANQTGKRSGRIR